MIKYKGKELRNSYEQILKNQQDIADLEVINGYDIHVVGQVDTAEELPNPATYPGEFGDAYAVGAEEPYEIYIYTRPFAGETEAHWFNAGPLSVPGPEGPKGDTGETGAQGQKGNSVYPLSSLPNSTSGYDEGDMVLITGQVNLGNLYVVDTGRWVLTGNIRGAQGVQGIQGIQGIQGLQGPIGPQGPRGDVGGFIHIAGIVSSVESLPDPEELHDLTIAYLVGTEEPYNLYVQIGDTSEDAMWVDEGILNVATYVTVNGEFVGMWNADTKLDKKTDLVGEYLYGTAGSYQVMYKTTNSVEANTIPTRTNGGQIKVAAPVLNEDATPKSYVDSKIPQVVRLA